AEKPERTECSFNDAMEQVIEDAIFEAKRSGQVLTYSAPSREIKMWGNRELLSSAVENVIRNALKYAQPGPIDVRLSNEVGFAVVRVRDYGPGIPDSQLET